MIRAIKIKSFLNRLNSVFNIPGLEVILSERLRGSKAFVSRAEQVGGESWLGRGEARIGPCPAGPNSPLGLGARGGLRRGHADPPPNETRSLNG